MSVVLTEKLYHAEVIQHARWEGTQTGAERTPSKDSEDSHEFSEFIRSKHTCYRRKSPKSNS